MMKKGWLLSLCLLSVSSVWANGFVADVSESGKTPVVVARAERLTPVAVRDLSNIRVQLTPLVKMLNQDARSG